MFDSVRTALFHLAIKKKKIGPADAEPCEFGDELPPVRVITENPSAIARLHEQVMLAGMTA